MNPLNLEQSRSVPVRRRKPDSRILIAIVVSLFVLVLVAHFLIGLPGSSH
jgi:hypothetical protein